MNLRCDTLVAQAVLHRLAILCCLAAILGAVCVSPSKGQTAAAPDPSPTLIQTFQNLFAAEKAGDPEKVTAIYAQFEMPDHKEWFLKTFGEKEGATLDAKYSQSLQDSTMHLRNNVTHAQENRKSDVQVQVYSNPEEIKKPILRAWANAMSPPCPIYAARATAGPDDKNPYFLGEFVYVSGGFRYIDYTIMQALSTAPPMRVRVGGEIAKRNLIDIMDPIYPKAARDAHVQGTVKLHLVLAQDGTVEILDVVSGDPLLQEAAIEAVRHWRYKPTLLNGQPVEVDTTVDVNFQIKN
jgi:TonB family protein